MSRVKTIDWVKRISRITIVALACAFTAVIGETKAAEAVEAAAAMTAEAAEGERARLYGFAPAYPVEGMTMAGVERTARLPFMRHQRMVRMVLEIDEAGTVTGWRMVDSTLKAFGEYLDAYVKGVRFVPAEFEGKAVGSRLPVDFLFDPKRPIPEVMLSVDETGRVVERERYFAVFPLNEIYPPRIVEFPSLFVELHWRDTSSMYPYVLLGIGLDTAGRVTRSEVVRTNMNTYPQTTISASLWGTYEPLVVKGEKREAECFLLVSYYPQVIYPTKVWRAEGIAEAPVMERERIRLMADTVGLMARPVPRTPTGDSVSVTGARVYDDRDTSGAVFAIDTIGRLGVHAFDMVSRELTAAMRGLSGELTFYPALDYEGRGVRFRGSVLVTGLPSGKVRIKYVW